MHAHSLTTALTLYRSGTLDLAQAARQAGYSITEMRSILRAHGITRPDSVTAADAVSDLIHAG